MEKKIKLNIQKTKKKKNNIFLKINTRYVHIHKKQGYI